MNLACTVYETHCFHFVLTGLPICIRNVSICIIARKYGGGRGTMHMFDKNCFAFFLGHMVPKGETPLETRQLRCLQIPDPEVDQYQLQLNGKGSGLDTLPSKLAALRILKAEESLMGRIRSRVAFPTAWFGQQANLCHHRGIMTMLITMCIKLGSVEDWLRKQTQPDKMI